MEETANAYREIGDWANSTYDATQRPIDTRHVAITPRGLELGGFKPTATPRQAPPFVDGDDSLAKWTERACDQWTAVALAGPPPRPTPPPRPDGFQQDRIDQIKTMMMTSTRGKR